MEVYLNIVWHDFSSLTPLIVLFALNCWLVISCGQVESNHCLG